MPLQTLAEPKQCLARAAERGQRLLLQRDAPQKLLSVEQALLLGALGGLGVTTLRRQLRLELRALDGARPRALLGALGVPFGEPGRPIGVFGGLIESTPGSAQRALHLLLALTGLGKSRLGPLQVTARALLGALALREPRDELLALRARGEGGVGALSREPAYLARSGVVALTVDGDSDAMEFLGEVVQVVDEPRVGEEALRDRPGLSTRFDQIEQAPRAVLRRLRGRSWRTRRDQSPRRAVGARQPLPALADRTDDGGAQPFTEHRRHRPLEAGAGLDQAGERLVLALDRRGGELRLDGCELTGKGRLPLGGLTRFGQCTHLHLRRPAKG